ncbi:glycoside hydrolase family 20 zincin-like fold domain-containing protein [uncultured Paludibaculum sp.]|uniref:glycoside hydrolase family 20 zincin-like fold domain-containing protein n=1 Tax=uncultured Paludibaculum sp. TaxID=1765020 RepID=UPI002AAAA0CA|nr:glycoside hydrolase family 20 zincin-like fold domain-containing protein [uncultured Paludibaculum sp.]
MSRIRHIDRGATSWTFKPLHLLVPSILVTLLASTCGAQSLSALAERGYHVLPLPQQIQLEPSDLRFGPTFSIQNNAGSSASEAVASLQEHMAERFGLKPALTGGTPLRFELRAGSVVPGPTEDSNTAAIAEQAYSLQIGQAGIHLRANAPAGLFYAVQTLVQLLQWRNGTLWLPSGRITDWPDLHRRHIYWDDAHHLERLPELKRAVRQAAFFKINGFALKLEGHFQFASAPAVVEPYAMTPAEYQELTDYALRHQVQLIPFLDGPAHLAFLLKHPQYAPFRSFPDSNYELCAVNPGAVKLLSGMFQDLINANRGGKYVYLSTDEPYYIGLAESAQCQEKTAAAKAGSVGRLLADFIGRVADPIHAQGRTVIFWGEYPLKPEDIAALPSHLVNGEVYGPRYDPVFRQRGIRQMLYTSTQGEERLFPNYFTLPNARLLHPASSQSERVSEGFREISAQPARGQAQLIGSIVAGWADAGLHPETFWLGYAAISAAAWHPGTPAVQESMAAFYRNFYGGGARNMNRVYQLLSQQARFWSDSWEWGPSSRKPLFGDSDEVFHPRQPVKDQTLGLPPAPSATLDIDLTDWNKTHARRLELAADFLGENDELLALLHENAGQVAFNRYNLEVALSVAHLCRQNLEMLLDLGRISSQLQNAREAARNQKAREAVEALDRVLRLARGIQQRRNTTLRDTVATWQKSWYPRAAAANGRTFLHELDDVKDHVPDRTVDMRYLIQRELDLPFGDWVESIRTARNAYAAANSLPTDSAVFHWLEINEAPDRRPAQQ